MTSFMGVGTDRRRIAGLAAYYALALAMIGWFVLRESFVVPSFVYQNF